MERDRRGAVGGGRRQRLPPARAGRGGARRLRGARRAGRRSTATCGPSASPCSTISCSPTRTGTTRCAARAWQVERGLRTHLNARGAASARGGDLRLVGVAAAPGPGSRSSRSRSTMPSPTASASSWRGSRVEAHFMPGHTPDSTVFCSCSTACGRGIVGDVAFGPKAGRLGALGFLCALWQSDLDDYVASLRRLGALELELLVPGHGAPVRGRERVRGGGRRRARDGRALRGRPEPARRRRACERYAGASLGGGPWRPMRWWCGRTSSRCARMRSAARSGSPAAIGSSTMRCCSISHSR